MVAMVEMQSILLEMVTRVFTHAQHWLWEVLVWLVDEEGERIVKTIGEMRYEYILALIRFPVAIYLWPSNVYIFHATIFHTVCFYTFKLFYDSFLFRLYLYFMLFSMNLPFVLSNLVNLNFFFHK